MNGERVLSKDFIVTDIRQSVEQNSRSHNWFAKQIIKIDFKTRSIVIRGDEWASEYCADELQFQLVFSFVRGLRIRRTAAKIDL